MAAPLTLSAVETELLRDVRSRLNRKAVSEAALNALGSAFLTACERVDIGPAVPMIDGTVALDVILKVSKQADMKMLRRLVAILQRDRAQSPKAWPAAVAAGAPQSILSRRLALAGREPAIEGTIL